MSLLVAWIVARLRKRNFKKLQGQNCQSIKSEKFVEGVEGKPGAGHGGEKEDLTQGDSSFLHLSSLRKGLLFLGLLAAGQGEGHRDIGWKLVLESSHLCSSSSRSQRE